jgi:prolipoprotein diacylglyceryl transferase
VTVVWDLQPQIFASVPLPRWYGLWFAGGFAAGFAIMRHMFVRDGKEPQRLDQLLLYVVIGTIAGMRLGHCLLYEPGVYLKAPWDIFMLWKGGYASHGGFAGVLAALWLYTRKDPEHGGWWLADRTAIAAMIAAAAIRIGNFFNSEMIGHPTDGPFAVVFKLVDDVPRHPAQLYEAVGYSATAALGYALYRRGSVTAHPRRLCGVIMILGFGWRTFTEFFKEDQVGFEAGMLLNMGQLLSLPFLVVGLWLCFRRDP